MKVFLYEMASIGMRAKTAQRYVEAVSLQYKLQPAARNRLSVRLDLALPRCAAHVHIRSIFMFQISFTTPPFSVSPPASFASDLSTACPLVYQQLIFVSTPSYTAWHLCISVLLSLSAPAVVAGIVGIIGIGRKRFDLCGEPWRACRDPDLLLSGVCRSVCGVVRSFFFVSFMADSVFFFLEDHGIVFATAIGRILVGIRVRVSRQFTRNEPPAPCCPLGPPATAITTTV